MKKIICLALACILCFGMCACADKTSSVVNSYVGNTYAGVDPWGEKVSITVDKVEGSKVDLTYNENIDADRIITCACAADIESDDSVQVDVKGTQDNVDYEYILALEFKDNTIVMTYFDGQKTEKLEDGDSGFHMVGALADDARTVVLECK